MTYTSAARMQFKQEIFKKLLDTDIIYDMEINTGTIW